jgi:antirestriction protein ArdC
MSIQINFESRLPYNGKNQDALQEAKQAKQFEKDEWLTFVQALKAGRVVRKGEKGVRILAYGKTKDKDGRERGNTYGRKTVFNIIQTDVLTK